MLVPLSLALTAKDYSNADSIHVALMIDHVSEVLEFLHHTSSHLNHSPPSISPLLPLSLSLLHCCSPGPLLSSLHCSPSLYMCRLVNGWLLSRNLWQLPSSKNHEFSSQISQYLLYWILIYICIKIWPLCISFNNYCIWHHFPVVYNM